MFDINNLHAERVVFLQEYPQHIERQHTAEQTSMTTDHTLQAQLETARLALQDAEATIEHLTQELEESRKYKNEFLLSMSHELRTPLNAMIGYTSLTLHSLRGVIAPEHIENLIKAERAARSLLQLINDILDFSKIQAGKVQVNLETCDLTDIIDDVLASAESQVGDKPVELRQSVTARLPQVQSDYAKIKQILENLVNNAVKFTAQGTVTVRATADADRNAILTEVEDTGEGIPEKKLSSIFELFKQADGSTKKKFRGTGLGLAITKSFCEMLHIEIGVRSVVGKGTTFLLHIPMAFTADVTCEHVASSASSSVASPPKADAAPPSNIIFSSVMIVDDDEMNLDLHRSIFQRGKYTVYLARSGKECLALLESVKPDVILMDIGMPGMDGFEVTHHIKQQAATAHIPVIACSAFATKEIQEKAIKAGCAGYISKPVDPVHFVAQVANILHATRSQQA